jgi:alanine racemase
MGPHYAGSLVRPGIFLYGGVAGSLQPEPVAALRARVVSVRRLGPGDTVSYGAMGRVDRATSVATVAVGYADGVPRSLAPGGRVEFAWGLAPIAGRVTMDLIMADVGDAPVGIGDLVTIFGGRIALDEQAAAAGTISYELLTRVAPRAPRRYTGG